MITKKIVIVKGIYQRGTTESGDTKVHEVNCFDKMKMVSSY